MHTRILVTLKVSVSEVARKCNLRYLHLHFIGIGRMIDAIDVGHHDGLVGSYSYW